MPIRRNGWTNCWLSTINSPTATSTASRNSRAWAAATCACYPVPLHPDAARHHPDRGVEPLYPATGQRFREKNWTIPTSSSQPAHEYRCTLWRCSTAAMPKRLRQNPRDWLLQVQYAISQSLIRQFTNRQRLFVGHRRQRRQSVPLLQPGRDTGRNDRLHIEPGQPLPANFDRLRPGEQTLQHPYPHLQLRRSHRRPGQDDLALPGILPKPTTTGERCWLFQGKLPEAFEDFSRAIELNPLFAEAFYNRGMTQIYMKDTRKGCLDLSKAGELGITSAYEILTLHGGAYSFLTNNNQFNKL